MTNLTDFFSGGGGKIPINAYAPLLTGPGLRTTTDDGSIWLKTGVVYTSDGSGSATDADTYPDAHRTTIKTGVSVTRTGSPSVPSGFFTQWWKNEILFITQANPCHKFSMDKALVQDTSFSPSLTTGGWAPAFYDGTKQYSMQARTGYKVGANDWTMGQSIFEVTGDWPNYTSVGSAITSSDNHLNSFQDWDGHHGWVVSGDKLLVATEDGLYFWNNWKTTISSTSTMIVSGNSFVLQTNNDTYWTGKYTGGGPTTAYERYFSDNSLTGESLYFNQTAYTGIDLGAPWFPVSTAADAWYVMASHGANMLLDEYAPVVGEQTAYYSRGFTDNVASTVNGVASVGLPRVVSKPIYVKIGNKT